MPRGSRARLEVFAQALAAGNTPVEAARIAKYPNGTSFAANARKRAQRADVKARVAELRAPALEKVKKDIEISVEWAAKKLAAIADFDLGAEITKVSDQIAAINLLAKINGWMAPEKSELSGKNGGPIGVSNISDMDRAIALAALIAKVKTKTD